MLEQNLEVMALGRLSGMQESMDTKLILQEESIEV